jgi:hypothetical protein
LHIGQGARISSQEPFIMQVDLSIRFVMSLMLPLMVAATAPQDAPVRRTPGADAFRTAIDLAPDSAMGVFVIPSLKLASDDLAECLARVEGDASAVPLRPLDLVRAQAGVGSGIDENGSFVLWSQMDGDRAEFCVLVPVLDGKAAIEASLKRAADGQPGFDHPQYGRLHARDLGRHVLVSRSQRLVDAYNQKAGLHQRIRDRLGARGSEVLLSGDAGAWGGPEAMRQMRQQRETMRGGFERLEQGKTDETPASNQAAAGSAARADLDGNGEIDNGDRAMLLLEMGARGENRADLNRDGVVDDKDQADLDAMMGRKVPKAVAAQSEAASAQRPATSPAEGTDGLLDGVISIDLDPLGVSMRTYAVMAPDGPLGKATAGGPRGEPARLSHLPKGPFVIALAADMRGLGGGGAFIDLASQVPGAPAVPDWVRENRDLIEGMEFAIYPSKLGIAGGGMLNEAIAWLATREPSKARTLLRDWMKGLAGIDGATERKVTWEEGRALKDGTVTDAYAVVDAPAPKDATPAAGRRKGMDPMQRMARAMVFGPRGPHGFAKEMPGGLVITFSQRPDVLQRSIRGAEGRETLQAEPVIEALGPWIAPESDIVGYVGVGSLLSMVRQAANSFPGMSLRIPDAPPSLEPVAFSVEVQDGRVETGTMIPTAVIGVISDAYRSSQAIEGEDGFNEEPTDPETVAPRPKGQKSGSSRGKPSPDEDP